MINAHLFPIYFRGILTGTPADSNSQLKALIRRDDHGDFR